MSYKENIIINLIKELELNIQQLQEENKKLKEELFETQHYLDTKKIVNEQLKQEKQDLVEALTDLVEKWLTDNGDIYFEKAEELINKYK